MADHVALVVAKLTGLAESVLEKRALPKLSSVVHQANTTPSVQFKEGNAVCSHSSTIRSSETAATKSRSGLEGESSAGAYRRRRHTRNRGGKKGLKTHSLEPSVEESEKPAHTKSLPAPEKGLGSKDRPILNKTRRKGSWKRRTLEKSSTSTDSATKQQTMENENSVSKFDTICTNLNQNAQLESLCNISVTVNKSEIEETPTHSAIPFPNYLKTNVDFRLAASVAAKPQSAKGKSKHDAKADLKADSKSAAVGLIAVDQMAKRELNVEVPERDASRWFASLSSADCATAMAISDHAFICMFIELTSKKTVKSERSQSMFSNRVETAKNESQVAVKVNDLIRVYEQYFNSALAVTRFSKSSASSSCIGLSHSALRSAEPDASKEVDPKKVVGNSLDYSHYNGVKPAVANDVKPQEVASTALRIQHEKERFSNYSKEHALLTPNLNRSVQSIQNIEEKLSLHEGHINTFDSDTRYMDLLGTPAAALHRGSGPTSSMPGGFGSDKGSAAMTKNKLGVSLDELCAVSTCRECFDLHNKPNFSALCQPIPAQPSSVALKKADVMKNAQQTVTESKNAASRAMFHSSLDLSLPIERRQEQEEQLMQNIRIVFPSALDCVDKKPKFGRQQADKTCERCLESGSGIFLTFDPTSLQNVGNSDPLFLRLANALIEKEQSKLLHIDDEKKPERNSSFLASGFIVTENAKDSFEYLPDWVSACIDADRSSVNILILLLARLELSIRYSHIQYLKGFESTLELSTVNLPLREKPTFHATPQPCCPISGLTSYFEMSASMMGGGLLDCLDESSSVENWATPPEEEDGDEPEDWTPAALLILPTLGRPINGFSTSVDCQLSATSATDSIAAAEELPSPAKDEMKCCSHTIRCLLDLSARISSLELNGTLKNVVSLWISLHNPLEPNYLSLDKVRHLLCAGNSDDSDRRLFDSPLLFQLKDLLFVPYSCFFLPSIPSDSDCERLELSNRWHEYCSVFRYIRWWNELIYSGFSQIEELTDIVDDSQQSQLDCYINEDKEFHPTVLGPLPLKKGFKETATLGAQTLAACDGAEGIQLKKKVKKKKKKKRKTLKSSAICTAIDSPKYVTCDFSTCAKDTSEPEYVTDISIYKSKEKSIVAATNSNFQIESESAMADSVGMQESLESGKVQKDVVASSSLCSLSNVEVDDDLASVPTSPDVSKSEDSYVANKLKHSSNTCSLSSRLDITVSRLDGVNRKCVVGSGRIDEEDLDNHGTWETVEPKSGRGNGKYKALALANSGRNCNDRNGSDVSFCNSASVGRNNSKSRTRCSRQRSTNRRIVRDASSSVLGKVDEEANRRRRSAAKLYIDEQRTARNEQWKSVENAGRSHVIPSLATALVGQNTRAASLRDAVLGLEDKQPFLRQFRGLPLKTTGSTDVCRLDDESIIYFDNKRISRPVSESIDYLKNPSNAKKSCKIKAKISSKHVSSSSADQNTASTLPETLSGVSAATQSTYYSEGIKAFSIMAEGNPDEVTIKKNAGIEGETAVSDKVEVYSACCTTEEEVRSREAVDKHSCSGPPLPTLLGPGNTNSASSSVASSLEAPHATRHRPHRHQSSYKDDDVGSHLLDVCDKLSNDMHVFMNRRSSALSLRRRERGALLEALHDTLEKIWPGQCHIEMYGSCATQLDLPSSDLDTVVCGLDRIDDTSVSIASKPSKANPKKPIQISTENGFHQPQLADSAQPNQYQTPCGVSPHHDQHLHHHFYASPPINGARVMRLAAELELQPWAVQVKAIPSATVPVIKILADPSRLPGAVDWMAQQQQQLLAAQAAIATSNTQPLLTQEDQFFYEEASKLPMVSQHGYCISDYRRLCESNQTGFPASSTYLSATPPWRGADVMNGLISLDVTFEGPEHGGLSSTAFSSRFVQEMCNETGLHPDSIPAVQVILVIKELLAQRRLNEPFSGGLSSYAILLLVVAIMKERRAIREDMEMIKVQRRAFACESSDAIGSNDLIRFDNFCSIVESKREEAQKIPSDSVINEHTWHKKSLAMKHTPTNLGSNASVVLAVDKPICTPMQTNSKQENTLDIQKSFSSEKAKVDDAFLNSDVFLKQSQAPMAATAKKDFPDCNVGALMHARSSVPPGSNASKLCDSPRCTEKHQHDVSASVAGEFKTFLQEADLPVTSQSYACANKGRKARRPKLECSGTKLRTEQSIKNVSDSLTEMQVEDLGLPKISESSSEGTTCSEYPTSPVLGSSLFPQGSNDVLEVLCSGEATAGKLLMHFLLFYGQHFDSGATCIDVSGTHHPEYAQRLVLKTGVEISAPVHYRIGPFLPRKAGGSFDPVTGVYTVDPVIVYDPLEGFESNNVAKRCFAWNNIRWVFEQSYMTLSGVVERGAGVTNNKGLRGDRESVRSKTATAGALQSRREIVSSRLDMPEVSQHGAMDGVSPLLKLLLSF